jgi:hypothetical protein
MENQKNQIKGFNHEGDGKSAAATGLSLTLNRAMELFKASMLLNEKCQRIQDALLRSQSGLEPMQPEKMDGGSYLDEIAVYHSNVEANISGCRVLLDSICEHLGLDLGGLV